MPSKDPLDKFDASGSHRFKHGKSGNPRGRPREAKATKTIVQKVAHERHRVTENGQLRTLSAVELIIQSSKERR